MELTWEALEEECKNCRKCQLGETRTNCVFGAGNKNADLMFIGEAPGEKEDLSGVPFVGPAGKLFDKFLYAVDIPREEVYIANMLKCRPPRNRDPLPVISFTKSLISVIVSRLIFTLISVSVLSCFIYRLMQ